MGGGDSLADTTGGGAAVSEAGVSTTIEFYKQTVKNCKLSICGRERNQKRSEKSCNKNL